MSISLQDYRTLVDELKPGETMRVDHNGCDAGEDTRRRLYLTRVMADPTKVIGYCHNCAEGGIISDGTYQPYRDKRHNHPFTTQIQKTVVQDLQPPQHMLPRLSTWPVYAQAWAMKNKLTPPMLASYGIEYDPTSDRVYLPRYRAVDTRAKTAIVKELRGYQLRLCEGKGSKYITVVGQDDKGYTIISATPQLSTDLVIVEDYVSGIHIAEAFKNTQPLDILVNYGVKINALAVAEAAKYDNVVIWLDNDSHHVISQAKHYARTIELYSGREVALVDADRSDPKHYDGDKIYSIMEDAWTT